MPVLEARVEHEAAGGEIPVERVELAGDGGVLLAGEDADPLQALGMHPAGGDVEAQELAVQQHVVAGAEALDALVDADAGFLPEQVGHVRLLSPLWMA
jgi:hypothetical protein